MLAEINRAANLPAVAERSRPAGRDCSLPTDLSSYFRTRMTLTFIIKIITIFRRLTRWLLPIVTSFVFGGRGIPAAVRV